MVQLFLKKLEQSWNILFLIACDSLVTKLISKEDIDVNVSQITTNHDYSIHKENTEVVVSKEKYNPKKQNMSNKMIKYSFSSSAYIKLIYPGIVLDFLTNLVISIAANISYESEYKPSNLV